MKVIIRNLVIIVIYICGVVLFTWPDLNHLKVNMENKTVLEEFYKTSESIRKESETQNVNPEPESSPGADVSENSASADPQFVGNQELYQKLKEYNQELFETGQKNLSDPWSYRQNTFDLSAYGVKDDVIALLKIPAMDIELPVYLGANEQNMAKGAGHLTETSMPVGGENTNCVIAAHRGWKGIPMFRDIEKLELGDTLTMTNYWETLTYVVTEIKVIKPNDSHEIFIQPDKDMVTILTCHPYTKNYRRYVVYFERTETDEVLPDVQESEKNETEKEYEQNNVQNSESIQFDKIRKEAVKEDEQILSRDILLRKAGYAVLGLIGVLIIISVVRDIRNYKRKTK